ncbi:hypothetical protein ACFWN1_09815 [Streptomyces sp. NPDC058459]|uniref:hypothetical protein n=1 Tax=Streptomyces sp. NPDC058459 TaxID=3346508 RepID=UPI00365883F5
MRYFGQGLDGGCQGTKGGLGSMVAGQVREQHVAGGPFDQRADGGLAVLADDQSPSQCSGLSAGLAVDAARARRSGEFTSARAHSGIRPLPAADVALAGAAVAGALMVRTVTAAQTARLARP